MGSEESGRGAINYRIRELWPCVPALAEPVIGPRFPPTRWLGRDTRIGHYSPSGCGLRLSRLSVTPFALEGGHLLARLDHDRGRLTSATTLSHDFRGKFLDRLGGCGHRLLSLRSEFGLAE